jgi:hypothetical protein
MWSANISCRATNGYRSSLERRQSVEETMVSDHCERDTRQDATKDDERLVDAHFYKNGQSAKFFAKIDLASLGVYIRPLNIYI